MHRRRFDQCSASYSAARRPATLCFSSPQVSPLRFRTSTQQFRVPLRHRQLALVHPELKDFVWLGLLPRQVLLNLLLEFLPGLALCTQGAQSNLCPSLRATFTRLLTNSRALVTLIQPINLSSGFQIRGRCSWLAIR